eukprot:196489_1
MHSGKGLPRSAIEPHTHARTLSSLCLSLSVPALRNRRPGKRVRFSKDGPERPPPPLENNNALHSVAAEYPDRGPGRAGAVVSLEFIARDLRCCICSKMLRVPVMQCGLSFYHKLCLTSVVDEHALCRRCPKPLDEHRCSFVERVLEPLVECKWDECDEIFHRDSVSDHEDACPHRHVSCALPDCMWLGPRATLDEHARACRYGEIPCVFGGCESRFPRAHFMKHVTDDHVIFANADRSPWGNWNLSLKHRIMKGDVAFAICIDTRTDPDILVFMTQESPDSQILCLKVIDSGPEPAERIRFKMSLSKLAHDCSIEYKNLRSISIWEATQIRGSSTTIPISVLPTDDFFKISLKQIKCDRNGVSG